MDLTGFMRASEKVEAAPLARFLDDWYGVVAEAVAPAGGRIVKCVGDGCLVAFPPERCADAVGAVSGLGDAVAALGKRHGVKVGYGANVHLAVVADGEIGPPDDRRRDLVGAGVNYAFTMGNGAGVRVSEPVYRQLPNDRRRAWRKRKPPATYTLES